MLDLLNEEALARAPVAEQADGERRLDGFGRQHRRQGIDFVADAEQVFAGRAVGGIAGHAPAVDGCAIGRHSVFFDKRFRRFDIEQRVP